MKKLIPILLFLAGCSLSVPARKELALPDMWSQEPCSVEFSPVAVKDPKVSSDQIKAASDAVNYTSRYLTKLGFNLSKKGNLTINVHLYKNKAGVNLGYSHTDLQSRVCTVELNMDRVEAPTDFFNSRAVRTLVVHEVGHCLGLVVTATESAQRTEGDGINHCRHLDCAMTISGVGSTFNQAAGWLVNAIDGDPTYDKHCEEYLRSQLAKAQCP